MKTKIAGIALALSGFAMPLMAHAQTPAYTMDTGVQDGITSLLTSFVTGAFGIIVVAVGIVGGYYVTVRLVHVLLRWFHKFA